MPLSNRALQIAELLNKFFLLVLTDLIPLSLYLELNHLNLLHMILL